MYKKHFRELINRAYSRTTTCDLVGFSPYIKLFKKKETVQNFTSKL